MLMEVLRKLWISILISRIKSFLTINNILNATQHGFLPGRGTDTACIQLLNVLEEARECCTDIFLVSWDVTREFDSIHKTLLKLSWTRLGVPDELPTYIVTMDT